MAAQRSEIPTKGAKILRYIVFQMFQGMQYKFPSQLF